MSDQEDWGEPPHPDVVARLLAERHPIRAGERLRVDVDEADGRLVATLWNPRHRWAISVRWEAGGDDSPWMLMADALDALFGALIESGRAHRELPAGAGVEHQGARFTIEVQHDLPEVTRLADQLLAATGGVEEV